MNQAAVTVVFVLAMLVFMGIGVPMALALVLTGAAMAWTLGFWDTQLLAQNLGCTVINAGAARVKELGGEATDPMPVPQMGWFAACTDPHGNEFGLWQTDPSAPTPEQ